MDKLRSVTMPSDISNDILTKPSPDVHVSCSGIEWIKLHTKSVILDTLTSTDDEKALSANQGKILNEIKADKNHTHAYSSLTGIPEVFPPQAHSHQDLYLTEEQIDSKISGLTSGYTTEIDKIRYNQTTLATRVGEIYANATVLEETITLVEDRYSTLEQKVTNAEQKITPDSIVSTVTSSSKWSELIDGTTDISDRLTTMEDLSSIIDTRDFNQLPEWYMENYPMKTVKELKNASIIGIPDYSYGTLVTEVPYYNTNGGRPIQVFYPSNSDDIFRRFAFDNTTWGQWTQVAGSHNIASMIRQTPEAIDIIAENINLTGKITFGSLDEFTQDKINSIETNLQSTVSNVDVEYYQSTSSTELLGGTWQTICPPWVDGQYIWQRTKTSYVDGRTPTYTPSENGTCISGAKGEDGQDGETIEPLSAKRNWNGTFTTVGDIASTSVSDFNRTPRVGDIFLNIDGSSNMGRWEIVSISNNVANFKLLSYMNIKGIQGLQGLQGPQGEQGIQGPKGTDGTNGTNGINGVDGKTSYFHIKYSNVASPTSSSEMTETPSTYIGTYVDFNANDSTNPSSYTWHRFEGLQGAKGDQGIPGTNGTNGKTTYLHIKYSNDGENFTPNNGEDVGIYIGTCTDYSSTDPTSFNSYKWAKIQGPQGVKGDNGLKGDKGDTGPAGTGVASITEEYYVSTSKTTQTGGSWSTNTPTWSSGKYIWTRSKIVYKNPAKTEYTTPVCDSSWEAVNEIEVGGRNFLLNSGKWNELPTTFVNNGGGLVLSNEQLYEGYQTIKTTVGSGIRYKDWVSVDEGELYTLSALLWSDTNVNSNKYFCPLHMQFTNDFSTIRNWNTESVVSYNQSLVAEKWNKVHATFRVPSGVKGIRPFIWAGSYYNATVYVAYLKFEKGNKPTDWIPAPEDVQNQITSTNNKVTAKYAECDTPSATAAKVVTLGNFSVYKGAQVTVKFNFDNTAENPTLNVNNTGAKYIYARDSKLIPQYYWGPNDTVTFTYDGTNWVMDNTSANSILASWCYNNDKAYIDGGVIAAGTVTTEVLHSSISQQISDNTTKTSQLVHNYESLSQSVATIEGNYFTKAEMTTTAEGIITNIVSNNYVPKDEFTKLQDSLGDYVTSTSLSQRIDGLNISQIVQQITDDKALLDKIFRYIHIGESNGIWGVTVGEEGKGVRTVQQSDRFSFFDGDTEVAYITSKLLHIMSAVLTEELVVGKTGNFFHWKIRSNGNYSLTWDEGGIE